jgi:hypothetical protein
MPWTKEKNRTARPSLPWILHSHIIVIAITLRCTTQRRRGGDGAENARTW